MQRNLLVVVRYSLLPVNEVWSKVIFLHLFVILFTGGYLGRYTPRQVHSLGRYPLARYTSLGRYTPLGSYPPRQVHPQEGTPPGRYTPQAGTPLGRYTPQAGTPPGQVHPWAGTPPGQVHPLGRYTRGRYTLPPAGTHTPQCMLGYDQQSGRYASYWNAFLL